MKVRLVVFTRPAQGPLLFACPTSNQFLFDVGVSSLETFAHQQGLHLHGAFGRAVGMSDGVPAALLEAPSHPGVTVTLALPSSRGTGESPWPWLPFPRAVSKLRDGVDRNLLQRAVQFLAAGATVDESVAAAPVTEGLLDDLKRGLTRLD